MNLISFFNLLDPPKKKINLYLLGLPLYRKGVLILNFVILENEKATLYGHTRITKEREKKKKKKKPSGI